MSNNLSINIEIDVSRSVEEVFEFASNIVNLPLYDKGISEVEKITEGPIGVGSTFHLSASQFGIRMIAVLLFTTYEPPLNFAFRVNAGPFPVETHYALSNVGSRTQVTGMREPQARGMWKLLMPIISIPARRKFQVELNNLKNFLETH